MKTGIMLGILGLILSVSVAEAQWRGTTPGGDTGEYLRTNSVSGLRGLLDPSRIHMSHSMSMGYMSSGDVSASRGLYMNRLDYQISRPVSLTTYLGYQFQPSGPEEWNPANNGSSFVGGADLNWRPTRNSLLSLSVYNNMSPHGGYGRYGSYGSWNPYGYYAEPWRP